MKVFIIGSVGESENNIALVAGEFRNLGCDVRYVYKQEKPFAKLVSSTVGQMLWLLSPKLSLTQVLLKLEKAQHTKSNMQKNVVSQSLCIPMFN